MKKSNKIIVTDGMKICIVPTMFPKYKGDYYGSFVFDEAKALADKGVEVHVVTQHNQNAPYEEILDGVHVHRFRWLEPQEFRALVHFKGLKDDFRLVTYLVSLFFNLMWILRKYDIDLIHSHSVIPTGLVGVIVAKFVRKPVFITSHGMDINNFENSSFFKSLIAFSLKNCSSSIAVSNDLAGKMTSLGINQGKIMVLKNAIDVNRFKYINNKNLRLSYCFDENDIILLFVGYLDVFKGVFEILDAFYEISKENKNIKLIMVGTGPKDKELKKIVSQLDLEESVTFTGKVLHEEIHEYYQMADVFVLPSYSEGLPLSILEAMASGTSVIASDVGGISEVIEDCENGLIVPPKNKKLLKEKLLVLIDDAKLREEFAKRSMELMRNEFDINKKIDLLIELYYRQSD